MPTAACNPGHCMPVAIRSNAALATIGDVVKARFDELEHEKKDLLDYVSSW